MVPCEHILSHKTRHRAHRASQVLFVFSPTRILDPSTHDLMKSTEYAIGPSISVGAGHTGLCNNNENTTFWKRSEVKHGSTIHLFLTIDECYPLCLWKWENKDNLLWYPGMCLRFFPAIVMRSRFLQANQQLNLAVTLLEVRNYICIRKGLMASL